MDAEILGDDRASQLRLGLESHGWRMRVESRGSLALLIAPVAAWPDGPVARRHMVRLAQEAGFTHVAIELETSPGDT